MREWGGCGLYACMAAGVSICARVFFSMLRLDTCSISLFSSYLTPLVLLGALFCTWNTCPKSRLSTFVI